MKFRAGSGNFETNELTVSVDEETLAELDTVTFLGLVLDSYLAWRKQIEQLCSKINSSLYLIKIGSMHAWAGRT